MSDERFPHPRPPVSPAPRRLLARVRDVMAGPGSAAERLDRMTAIIAADMVAEVCSIYVRRPGGVLELFSTQGLKKSAVHKTRLRMGEGLVGEIAVQARPIALADAQEHPSFAYRPETGEEIYQSLMGVPVLRGGRVVGVVVVQNRTRRNYDDEEVETLQTVAMVVAEIVAGGELIDRDELLVEAEGPTADLVPGFTLAGGLGIGRAVLHLPHVTIETLVADDPAAELERLEKAFSEMHGALDDMLGGGIASASGAHRDVLESYRMIAEDAGWVARIEEAIGTGLTAEAAVQKVQDDIRARMRRVQDPYLRERIHDFDDLANRLLQHLLGGDARPAARDIPEDAIVVARNMGPAELLDYDLEKLKGLVLEEGSPTAHVTVVARALQVPVVGHARGVTDNVEDGEPVIVDADGAQVFIRPADDVRTAFVDAARELEAQKAHYAAIKDLPAESADSQRVMLNMNAGLMMDMANLDSAGADGVGLFRTEIPFMMQPGLPDIETQCQVYAGILDAAGDRPVVFRTLDLGGDKVVPYLNGGDEAEDNPALGWRAIRMTLDEPDLLSHQLRALIRAAAGRELNIMFPMIAEVAEFDAARALLDTELEAERMEGGALPVTLAVGAMLEVPGLVYQLPALLSRVAFLSVGSNDMNQFLFASDRSNPRLADRYDELSPIVLAMLRSVVAQCREAGVPVSLCGEMAGRPVDAMALVGLGFRSLSMSLAAIGPVKEMVRSLDVGRLEAFMAGLDNADAHSLRDRLEAFAGDHGVVV